MTFLLPPHAHVPGQNARHPKGAFDHVKASALKVTEDATAVQNPAWLYGLELLAEEYFWECHEVLETVWLRAGPNSRARAAVQGVIQLANGGLKLRMQKPKAASRLAKIAEEHFQRAMNANKQLAMGLEVDAVHRAIQKIQSESLKKPDLDLR